MSDTSFETDLHSARIRYLVAAQRGAIAEAMRDLLESSGGTLTPSRVGTLSSAVAWHEQRQSASSRLQRLDYVINQLYERAEQGSAEQQLYIRLHRMIWPRPSPVWLARELALGRELPEPEWANFSARLSSPQAMLPRWETEATAQLAEAIMGIAAATFESRALYAQVFQKQERPHDD